LVQGTVVPTLPVVAPGANAKSLMATAFAVALSVTDGAGVMLAIPGIDGAGAAAGGAAQAARASAAAATSRRCFTPRELLMPGNTPAGYAPFGGTNTSTTPPASRTTRC